MNENQTPAKLEKWKQIGAPVKVSLKSPAGSTKGVVYLQTWDAQARTRRAIKWLAMLWGVGAFCIVLPIIHFIVPPLMLITGPVVAFLLSRQSSAVLGGHAKCPKCQADFEIVRNNYFKPTDEWPLTDSCANCREEVVIDRV